MVSSGFCSGQKDNRFHMARPREHVHGDAGGGGITLPGERGEIARERAGVAGDIHDPLRLHPDGVGDDALVQPAPRRIDDDAHCGRMRAPRKLARRPRPRRRREIRTRPKDDSAPALSRAFSTAAGMTSAPMTRAPREAMQRPIGPRAAVEIEARRHARRDTGIAERRASYSRSACGGFTWKNERGE